MKKIYLSLMAIVFAGNLSYAQSPIYTTAGNGANYSADGAYLAGTYPAAEAKPTLLIISVVVISADLRLTIRRVTM